MSVSVLIATYGGSEWEDLAWSRAWPSANANHPSELLCFHDPDGSIASVRNEVALTAKSDWLCFLDADDELAPGYLDAMKRAIGREGDGALLLTPAVQQIRKGRPGKAFFYPESDFTQTNWLVIGTLVPRSLFLEVGGFHEFEHGLEDWNFWARCVRAGAEAVKVPEAIYVQHWNAQSKHHILMRQKREYQVHYQAARQDAWA